MNTQQNGRIDSLTGVRILAAGGVFLSHIAAPATFPEFLRTFMASGYNGVTLFFMLSGFVLAWSYADRLLPMRPRALWSFVVARFARIYPLYLFALLIFIAPPIASGKGEPLMLIHALTLQTWSSHVERAYAYNGPGWSIGVEVFLYAMFPFVLLALAKIRKSTIALIIVGLAVIAAVFAITWWFVATGRADLPWSDANSAHRWLYRMPVTRLGDFVVGVIAAFIAQNYRAPVWIARIAQLVGVSAIILLMAWPRFLFTAWSWDAAYVIPFVLLIWGLAAGPETRLARSLATPTMVLAGEASFAFYLLHWPLLAVIGLPTDNWLAWLVAATLLFVLILLTAVGAHTLLERPSQRWIIKTLAPKPRAVGTRRQVSTPIKVVAPATTD